VFKAQCYAPASENTSSSTLPFKSPLPIRRGSQGYDKDADFVVKGYLPHNALACIYGPSGSYKSFLAISLACHVATGTPWAGQKVMQGAVVYVVGEGGIGVSRRIKAWEKVYNEDKPVTHLFRIDCPVHPASPESLAETLKAIQEIEAFCGMPVRLVILDTLARCFAGSDENTAKDMGAFIQGCDMLKGKTDASVLIIHHSGKDQDKGARGSSALRAALDTEYRVTRENEMAQHALMMCCTKMKDAQEPAGIVFELSEVQTHCDKDNEPVYSMVLNDRTGTAPLEDHLERYPELRNVPNLSDNHIAVWATIQECWQQKHTCTRDMLKARLKSKELDADKRLDRWLDKLQRAGKIVVNAQQITMPQQTHNKLI